jgi:type II secretory pathway component PulC
MLRVSSAALVLASTCLACGGGAPAPKVAAAPAPRVETLATVATDAAPASKGLTRSAVRRVVSAGLGMFLQKVDLDDQPVMKDGAFHGFRVNALRDAQLFANVDLRPGDVVVRVNGMPIERPEQALEAFRSLTIASELRVEYERDGAVRELRFPIVDDEPQKRADASAP